jgi:hypothetical protein
MRIRNKTQAPIMFQARTNAGKLTEYEDHNGNKVSKPEHPQSVLICVPAEAEVEIEDKLWLAAIRGTTTVKVFAKVQEVIPGATMDGKPVYRTIMEPTGATKKVNLIQERIKAGDLEITEKVKGSELELPVMIKALAAKKITVSKETHTPEEIADLYQTVCE